TSRFLSHWLSSCAVFQASSLRGLTTIPTDLMAFWVISKLKNACAVSIYENRSNFNVGPPAVSHPPPASRHLISDPKRRKIAPIAGPPCWFQMPYLLELRFVPIWFEFNF